MKRMTVPERDALVFALESITHLQNSDASRACGEAAAELRNLWDDFKYLQKEMDRLRDLRESDKQASRDAIAAFKRKIKELEDERERI